MKIRKILPLVLLAVGSVFLLSSCDALLDAIFSNDTITVYVSAYIPTYCIPTSGGYLLTSNTDSVTVSITGPKGAIGTANFDGYDVNYMYWSLAVPQLSDGPYTVVVTYHHPYGSVTSAPANWVSAPQYVTLPVGSSHSVNLSFTF